MFPQYDISTREQREGKVYKCHIFCQKMREKCLEFYCNEHDLYKKYVCPYGFIVVKIDENTYFNSIVVGGLSPENKIKSKNEKITRLDANLVDEFISLVKNAVENKQSLVNQESYVNQLAHEIRKLNSFIKNDSDYLLDYQDLPSDRYREMMLHIYQSSNLVSYRLDCLRFLFNQTPIGQKQPKIVHKMILKSAKILQSDMNSKNLHSQISDNDDRINAFDYIELVPFLIFENCIKYSPRNNDIEVTITSMGLDIEVAFSSLGPVLLEGECDNIFKKGFRGKMAKIQSGDGGQGIGLWLVKIICDLHGYSVRCQSEINTEYIAGQVHYAKFNIIISMHKYIN